jgi:hypothetical protein
MDPFELALRRRMLAASDRVLRPFDPLAITDAAAGPARVGLARRSSQTAMSRWLLVAAVVTVVAATLFGLAIAARPQLPVAPTPAPSALALVSLQPSPAPSARPSPSPSSDPTPPPATTGLTSSGDPVAGSVGDSRGFGMLFTYAAPGADVRQRISDRNDMTIEWWRSPSRFTVATEGRLTLLDHAPLWTDVCQWGSDTGVVWPVTSAQTIAWVKSAFGSRAVRRPSLEVDGRSVAVFDVTPGACDPFARKGDWDLAAPPFHRVYVIPSDADTILGYTALFDRSGIASVTDPLIESIHFVR